MMNFLGQLFKASEPFRLKGNRVLLDPLTRSDFFRIKIWLDDEELLRFAFGLPPNYGAKEKISDDYYWDLYYGLRKALSIRTLDGKHIGFASFHVRDGKRPVGKIGILIGERNYWCRGFGTEAMTLLLEYLFSEFHLDRVDLDTADFNERAQRCFHKCGFRTTGEISEIDMNTGETLKKVLMTLSCEEFKVLLRRVGHSTEEKQPIPKGDPADKKN